MNILGKISTTIFGFEFQLGGRTLLQLNLFLLQPFKADITPDCTYTLGATSLHQPFLRQHNLCCREVYSVELNCLVKLNFGELIKCYIEVAVIER